MTPADFIALVRTMRRDQLEYEEHLTSAANVVRKYSEKQVDEALAGMEEKADEAVCVEVAR